MVKRHSIKTVHSKNCVSADLLFWEELGGPSRAFGLVLALKRAFWVAAAAAATQAVPVLWTRSVVSSAPH